MPTLTVDNYRLTVPDGTTVLEAALAAGIVVPHFCWHPALGKAGSCRACAVKILEGPVKGIQMSCMLEASDGMVVSTGDPEALELRRQVLEWLMINHPHDCPVCDEGGECQLQDFTIAAGQTTRQYDGPKRTHLNQYLGPGLAHEMNRCIQCYRCVRFYQEYAGGTDFGVMGRAGMVYFGRQQDGPLESCFSGNLADICPTGVFTDKPSRYKGRYWDYQMAPSICPGCSLGCSTIVVARYRELLKIKSRRNDRVNGSFICDSGRYATEAVNDKERPRTARLNRMPCNPQTALTSAAVRLRQTADQYGPSSLVVLGSPRMSLEGNLMAARLAASLGGASLCYFGSTEEARRAEAALDHNRASLEDIRKADLLVLDQSDILKEGPIAALAVRQAWRNGAKIFVVGSEKPAWLASLSIPAENAASPAELPIAKAQRPVMICGAGSSTEQLHLSAKHGARLVVLSAAPNSTGCAMLAREHGAMAFDEAVLRGGLAVISFESDLKCLPEGVVSLIACDWQPTDIASISEIFLPTRPWVESDGTWINFEGRAQRFCKAMEPGTPISESGQHPDHNHRLDAPGSDPAAADQLISHLLELLTGFKAGSPYTPPFSALENLPAESDGLMMKVQ